MLVEGNHLRYVHGGLENIPSSSNSEIYKESRDTVFGKSTNNFSIVQMVKIKNWSIKKLQARSY